MNPRPAGHRRSPRRALTFPLVVAGLAILHAPAQAGCGSREGRPAVAIGGVGIAHGPGPTAPPGVPVCLGLSCPRDIPDPLATSPKVSLRHDVCQESRVTPRPARIPSTWVAKGNRLSPIGRVTDVDRPPCVRG